jgi:4-amino-4-deoxy-L-arabinose transferase-like glycosyltransferase
LTCIPVVFIARRTLGARTARLAGWIWVFFPYSIWVATERIWENALTTLLLAILVWFTLALDAERRISLWIGYGLLWGIAGLTNPAVFAVLPFLLLWTGWRRRGRGEPWFVRSALVVFMVVALITPWTIRNYRVFHRLMPLRSNFWMEVRVGNTGETTEIDPDWAHPRTAAQWNELHRLGEVAYMVEMRGLALRFIREHPGVFAWLTWRRFLFNWTGFWSLDPVYAGGEPFQIPNTFFCTTLTLLGLVGLVQVWRHHREWILPYAAVLGAYPAVYYVTHPSMDYRHPIDPMLVILSACAVRSLLDRRRSRSASILP